MASVPSEQEKAFLRACQQGDLKEAKRLLAEYPKAIEARSTSKGYTGMHFGAMGGSVRAPAQPPASLSHHRSRRDPRATPR